jgi:beta-lactam-binding protein with PASTA domain
MAVLFLCPPATSMAQQVFTAAKDSQGTTVPELIGHQFTEVGGLLESARLKVGGVDSAATPAAPGTILRQNPPAGTRVTPGTAVNVIFSFHAQGTSDGVGPQSPEQPPPVQVVDDVTVPDLSGSTRLGAMFTLALGKLGVGATHSVSDEQHAGKVFQQRPAAGERVPKGTDVEFWYGAELTVAVPDVRDSSLAAATRVLEDSRLKVGKVDDPEHSNRTGPVVSQRPKAGEVVTLGTSIRLSLGAPPGVIVPLVVGRLLQDANAALMQAGLASSAVEQVPSDRPAGTVLTQNPQAGATAARGSAVALGIAIPRPDTLVPDVVGRPLSEAERMIVGAGLRVDRVDSVKRDRGAGLVTGQRPTAGTRVPRGAAALLTVAMVPSPIRMLRVIDSTEAGAAAVLRTLGLTAITIRHLERSSDLGRVFAQVPEAGSLVQPGTPVKLEVAVEIAKVRVPTLADSDVTAARKLLSARGLILGDVTRPSGASEHAKIVAQTPAAGSRALRGTRINVTLASDGGRATPLIVPLLLGMRPDSAESLLTRATLRMRPIDSLVGYGQGGLVIRQDPFPGDSVASRATVRLWVGRGPDIPWLLVTGALVTLSLGGVATAKWAKARWIESHQPDPLPPPVPVLWLTPHVVPGIHPIGTDEDPVARHELQLTPHAGASATQEVEGDVTFTGELP